MTTTERYHFPDDASLARMTEAEKVAEYEQAIRAGWSDYEARGTIWPDVPAALPATPSGAALDALRETDAKLRRDAENVLTWEAPTSGDTLQFAHLRRFASEVVRLLDSSAALLTEHTALRAEVKRLTAEHAALREVAYMPGDWICPTCGFVQSMRILHAHSGNVSASDERALPCPNDGQFMERRAWRDHARDAERLWQQEHAEVAALSTRLAVADEDTARLDWLGAQANDVDQVISPPGYHGGPDDTWLLTHELAHDPFVQEWFGDTLRLAIDAARRSPAPEGSSDAR